MSILLRLSALLALASWAAAVLPDGRPHGNFPPPPAIPGISVQGSLPVTSRNGTILPAYTKSYGFQQLIDHNNPSLGTFRQRYWHTYEFYEPGGPIVLFTPGEVAADVYSGYLTNKTINGQIAQQFNGSTVILEHRFFGLSNPYDDLSVKSFKVHTVQQAIDDLAYFAQHVTLPMPGGDQVAPGKAPWILVGGSYGGALVSWTMTNHPGVFWAGYASSAVVQAITDFWGYFDPIQRSMPQNCSSDVQAVISHIDQVFTSGNTTQINSTKSLFGLGGLGHLDDVAGALRNNLWDWQSLQPTITTYGRFFQFCDALEVKNGVKAPASGWGLDYALQAWGKYWSSTYYAAVCGSSPPETCLGTYDATNPWWTITNLNNAARSWMWLTCNELGFYQTSPPAGTPSLVSKLVTPIYNERQCAYWFPEAFGNTAPVPTADAINAKYGGWGVATPRVFFANGQRDPWRDATVSSYIHPLSTSKSMPVGLGDGFHCSDLSTSSGTVDASIRAVQSQGIASMTTWLSQWKAGNTSSTLARRTDRPRNWGELSGVFPRIDPARNWRGRALAVLGKLANGNKPVNAWFRSAGQF